MAETPVKNDKIEATDDNSALAEMPLDTSNPLQMIAGITAIVQGLTRITIDWTNMEDGQGFHIRFYGEGGQLLREFEAFGVITQYLQVAADYLHSPWMATVMMVGAVLFMIAQMVYNYIQETYFWVVEVQKLIHKQFWAKYHNLWIKVWKYSSFLVMK